MSDNELELSRRKLLAGAGSIGFASAAAGLGTSAFFSDEETFANDSLVAGELDAKAAYSAHYSDWSPDEDDGVDVRMWDGPSGTIGGSDDLGGDETGLPTNDPWLVAVNNPDQFLDNTQYMAEGDASCPDGTDADDIEQPVIELDDIKPGDFGEVTFDFALCDNPGFVWLNGSLTAAAENGVTEPEGDATAEDGDADSTDPVDVELLDAARAAVWVDDGNNYQNGDEVIVVSGSLRSVLAELQTGKGLALGGNLDPDDGLGRSCFSHDRDGTGTADVHHVAFAWWVPRDVGNEIQSDSVTFDLGLYTEQCRHNGVKVDLDAVVESPEIQQLLTDLGHPSPADTSAEDFGSLGPVELRFDQARTRSFEADDPIELDGKEESTFHYTVVPSPVGSLEVTSTGEDIVLPPRFVFNETVPWSVKSELALTDDIGWPESAGGPAVLAVKNDNRAFVRGVTDTERTEIETETDSDVDIAIGFHLFGEEGYVAPPAADVGEPNRLVADGGTTSCGIAPPEVCDPAASGTTFVLDPTFGIVDSFTFDELFQAGGGRIADRLGDQLDCLEEYLSCEVEVFKQAGIFTVGIIKLWFATVLGLSLGIVRLNPRVVVENLLSLTFGTAWRWVFAPVIILAASYASLLCKIEVNSCLLSGQSQPGPIEVSLNPKGTFLRADFNPPAPAIIDLNEAGLSPGDVITIEQFGDTTSQPGGPEKRHSTIAVFSGTATLLGPSKKNRVPDAIDAGPDADTPRTFFGNESTNIPEDFRVADFDGSQSKVTVEIPSGATHLFIGIEDSESTDNTDPDDDYRVTITPQ